MSARLQSVEGRFQEGVAIGVLRGTIGAYAHVWGASRNPRAAIDQDQGARPPNVAPLEAQLLRGQP
ncbi:MAG: hypothetical protein JKY00_02040 [Roseicyclus sp.]|nr:hypothetical protein [Roseicyclus sp.]